MAAKKSLLNTQNHQIIQLITKWWTSQTRNKEIQNFLELNETENTTQPRPCGTGKTVLPGKHLALSAYIKKWKQAQINVYSLMLGNLKDMHGSSQTSKIKPTKI